MTEQELDLFMRNVLLDAIALDEETNTETIPYTPSLHHQKQIKAMLKNPLRWARDRERPVWKRALKRVAVILLVISLAFGSLMVVSPTARATFIRWVTEWYETHVVFRYAGDDSPSKTIALQLVEYYHTHWLQESYNPLTYYRALGLFREAAEEAGAEDFRPIVVSCGERRNELSGGNFTEENGNELSYYQAMLVVDYLVEQHGLDAVLEAFFEDEDFPESFGLTYQEALHAAETSFS